ncbi:hypothetical protein PG984_000191 [Apiospora sp. TS-2023a]
MPPNTYAVEFWLRSGSQRNQISYDQSSPKARIGTISSCRELIFTWPRATTMSPPFIKKFHDKLKRKSEKSPAVATAATTPSTAAQATALSNVSIGSRQQADDSDHELTTVNINDIGLTDLTSAAEIEKTFIEQVQF